MNAVIHPEYLIAEVKKRPGLYVTENGLDKSQKMALWRQIGASLFEDWDTWTKTDMYDKVIQMQKKWRSIRDAYNRELRAKKTGIRTNRKEYIYFKVLKFLSGNGDNEDDVIERVDATDQSLEKDDDSSLLIEKKSIKCRKRVTRSETRKSNAALSEQQGKKRKDNLSSVL